MMINLLSLAPQRGRVAGLLASLTLLALPALAQPTVSGVSPARNLRNAPRASNVSVTLSQTPNAGSTSALKVFGNQRGGLLSGTATISGNTITFDPGTNFRPGETVQATLTTAAQNTSNQPLAQGQVFSFTAAVGAGLGTFTAGTSLTVPTNGQGTNVGDINGDGLLDIVMGTGSNTLVTFRNLGGGTFAAPVSIATVADPSQVVLADVDNDGDLDAVVPGFTAGGVAVHRNVGGVLGASTLLPTGSNARSSALVDVNGDGYLDILTVNRGSSSVSLNLNNAGASFAAATNLGNVSGSAYSMAAADLNGDGKMDFVTANYTAGNLSVRMGNGNGTFTAIADVPMTGTPFGLALGDLNGDNIPDIVTLDRFGTSAFVALGVGDGTFGTYASVAVGTQPLDVQLGDLDADGDLDIVVTNYGSSTLNVCSNSGTGTFTTGTPYTTASGPFGTALGDLDANGSLDIVNASYGSTTVNVLLNQQLPDLTVSTVANISAGAYTNITVTGSGVGTLTGAVSVGGTLTVQSGGVLATNCQAITGRGDFELQAGGTLRICDAAGITGSGATGAVQLTGTRTYSPDASYVYNGTVAQVTGAGLPSQVRNLSTTNANAVTLTAPVSVAQVVTVGAAGNLVLNSQALTLLSSAAGTALVVNSGTGLVTGATATVQRYIDASGNTGASGYRHYAAPVSGATVGGLATSGFTPVVNAAYNTAANSVAVTPYPTVYSYDQSRVNNFAWGANLSAFDRGYQSPAALTEALAVGRGYTVQIGNNERVAFTGTLVNGSQAITGLTNSGAISAGWSLIGNPYPAPLDWGSVTAAQLPGVGSAAYVFQSTGPYVGRYTSYTNGVGAGSGLIATGQAFFVRATATTGSINLTNANRVTSYAATPAFQRTATDPRPLLRLSLGLGSQPATVAAAPDETFVYFEAGATDGFDSRYDAYKLPNPSGYYLGTASADAQPTGLSIDGRAPLAPATTATVPLWLSVPAGSYTLTATSLLNFAAMNNTAVQLRDGLTGTVVDLATTPSYSFSVVPGAASTGRFSLVFGTGAALANTVAAAGPTITLAPNPSEDGPVELTLSGLPATTRSVEAILLNTLGQVVGHATLPATQGATRASLPTRGLAVGVYLVRLRALDAQGQMSGHLPTQRLSVR
jgi:hypothetical protein